MSAILAMWVLFLPGSHTYTMSAFWETTNSSCYNKNLPLLALRWHFESFSVGMLAEELNTAFSFDWNQYNSNLPPLLSLLISASTPTILGLVLGAWSATMVLYVYSNIFGGASAVWSSRLPFLSHFVPYEWGSEANNHKNGDQPIYNAFGWLLSWVTGSFTHYRVLVFVFQNSAFCPIFELDYD